jgi:hypothetical protein
MFIAPRSRSVQPTESAVAGPEKEIQPKPNRRAAWMVVGGVALMAVVTSGILLVGNRGHDSTAVTLAKRQAEIEKRGVGVMPFDQNLTMHKFAKTDTGGIETVTANDHNDTRQVTLIQGHLSHERDLFAKGDFSDPMAIHGYQMPGLQDLRRGASVGQVTIEYAALPNGARLTYSTRDPDLVDALHTWFDTQLMDHGSHAMG